MESHQHMFKGWWPS